LCGAQEFAREPLFKNLHYSGRIAGFGLTNKKVEMLGHDNIAHNDEIVSTPDLFEGFQKEIATAGASQ
jgi:hypothetical protein